VLEHSAQPHVAWVYMCNHRHYRVMSGVSISKAADNATALVSHQVQYLYCIIFASLNVLNCQNKV